MGQFDRISGEQLRADLLRFGELIRQLENEGKLLRSAAELQTILGHLRQKLFAWEVRASLLPDDETPPQEPDDETVEPGWEDEGLAIWLDDSLRVVREAMEREVEAREEWGRWDHDRGAEHG